MLVNNNHKRLIVVTVKSEKSAHRAQKKVDQFAQQDDTGIIKLGPGRAKTLDVTGGIGKGDACKRGKKK